MIEKTGNWPASACEGLVALIPKDEFADSPLRQRPLTIMGLTYRMWSTLRMQHSAAWSKKWMHEGCSGGVAGKGPLDTAYPLALQAEAALNADEEFAGLSLDIVKCYDKIPPTWAIEVLEKLGLHPNIVRALKGMYRKLLRRLTQNSVVSAPFASLTAILQGCGMSNMLLNGIATLWCHWVELTPEAKARAHVDDWYATVGMRTAEAQNENTDNDQQQTNPVRLTHIEVVDNLIEVADKTSEFLSLLGLQSCEKKSYAFANKAKTRKVLKTRLKLQNRLLGAPRQAARVLGAHVQFTKAKQKGCQHDRVDAAMNRSLRLQWAPFSTKKREHLLATSATPLGKFGALTAEPPKAKMEKWRAAALRGIWGTKRSGRCAEIIWSVLYPGHMSDPQQALTFTRLQDFRKLLQQHPHVKSYVLKSWKQLRKTPLKASLKRTATGPVHVLWKEIHALGWSWEHPWAWTLPQGGQLPLAKGPSSWWKHVVRKEMRKKELKEAAGRRKGLNGLVNVDKDLVAQILKPESKKSLWRRQQEEERQLLRRRVRRKKFQPLTEKESGTAQSIYAAALKLQHQLCKAGLVSSDTCPWCNQGVREDAKHLLWTCPAWGDQREKICGQRAVCCDEWDEVTQTTCLPAIPPEERAYEEDLPPLAPWGIKPHEDVDSSAIYSYGKRVVYTDGSALHNSLPTRFWRAGYGMWWGPNSPLNTGWILRGPAQTIQRAELSAIVNAAIWEPRGLLIKTDSEWCYGGCLLLRDGGAPDPRWDHLDLWDELYKQIHSRAPEHQLEFEKIKAHSTQEDLRKHLISQQDYDGNNEADNLAKIGVQSHDGLEELTKQAKHFTRRRDDAKTMIRVAIAVVDARSGRIRKEKTEGHSEHDLDDAHIDAPLGVEGDDDPQGIPMPWQKILPSHAHMEARSLTLQERQALTQNFKKEDQEYLHILIGYFRRLKWAPPTAEHKGGTWLEMAIDVEVSTGLDLRSVKVGRGPPKKPSAFQEPLSLGEKARHLSRTVQALEKKLQISFIPGARSQKIWALRPVGLAAVCGTEYRPTVLGGETTMEAMIQSFKAPPILSKRGAYIEKGRGASQRKRFRNWSWASSLTIKHPQGRKTLEEATGMDLVRWANHGSWRIRRKSLISRLPKLETIPERHQPAINTQVEADLPEEELHPEAAPDVDEHEWLRPPTIKPRKRYGKGTRTKIVQTGLETSASIPKVFSIRGGMLDAAISPDGPRAEASQHADEPDDHVGGEWTVGGFDD